MSFRDKKKRVAWNKGCGIVSKKCVLCGLIFSSYQSQKRQFCGQSCGARYIWTGRRHKSEAIEKMRNRIFTDITRQKMSQTRKRLMAAGIIQPPYKGKTRPEASNKKISETRKKLFVEGKLKPYSHWLGKKLSSAHKEKIIKNTLLAVLKRPTTPELQVMEIIKDLNLPYRYVGNGEVIISGLCPDFINCNGQKKLIEVFGDYWHKPCEEKQRYAMFAQFGYRTLIIWEHELKDKIQVSNRLLEFDKNVIH